MSEKRRGLGRGLGALIPSSAPVAGTTGGAASRPVDLFFPEGRRKTDDKDSPASGTSNASEPQTPPTPGGTNASEIPESSDSSTKKKTGSKESKAGPGSQTPSAASAERVDSDGVEKIVENVAQEETTDLVEVPGARFAEISVDSIHPNRKQPRSVFNEEDMAELIHSVKEIGVLQPIVVRLSTEIGGEPYELVMGERRWRAVQAAGLVTVPAIVRDTNDDDLLRDALLENLHRSQLNPLEEAAAYQQLLEDFGTTHEQLADRIGRSRPQVSNTIRLLRLPALVQRRVAAGVISAGHARALLSLPDAAAMERLAQRIVSEGMSVRSTEEAAALYQEPSKQGKGNIPKAGARHERLDYLASSLSDRLDTNVKISLGVRKGRVSIEFASVEDLNRIMEVLAPDSDG
ncbi:ParB/RepB/Spo0J family partition protein [Pseudarthrobacter sp. PS3-L1]|uniref:ParB/RepB/Spo0J family partition protein n=1 Tax=Pseudarthrobacter sp. PS3-L1 TaxID=3046207 RepID=UPI0024BAF9E8|nr:ParB/RepB/Spo0J family partition protein [Pseudarthrobacter sp. PS3-L1]MDJ0320976.1 ParB/RepB/Spo0J family partition protein [Pseudarthrobacter sp. PS3-L1]